jgi:hypothetical protein
MSLVVLCNLSDGVVLGVDSALTISDTEQISKVFENSEKLFQLGTKIGVATYGIAGFEGRSIGNFVRQFEREHPSLKDQPMGDVAEEMRAFFFDVYSRVAKAIYGVPLDEISGPLNSVGFVIAGYSPGEFFSEAWEVRIPDMREPCSAKCVYGPGAFGLAWFAAGDPIDRYLNGIPMPFIWNICEHIETLLGRPLTAEEVSAIVAKRDLYRYRAMTDSMPLQTGASYVRFLVDFVIGHHKYSAGHPIVGGKAKIGVISYEKSDFVILE